MSHLFVKHVRRRHFGPVMGGPLEILHVVDLVKTYLQYMYSKYEMTKFESTMSQYSTAELLNDNDYVIYNPPSVE